MFLFSQIFAALESLFVSNIIRERARVVPYCLLQPLSSAREELLKAINAFLIFLMCCEQKTLSKSCGGRREAERACCTLPGTDFPTPIESGMCVRLLCTNENENVM